MSNRRSYQDKEYERFRRKVRKRDGKMCKWPGCGKKKSLNVHHILPWKQFPHLRYKESNGICLCKQHHKAVTGHELAYASFLNGLI